MYGGNGGRYGGRYGGTMVLMVGGMGNQAGNETAEMKALLNGYPDKMVDPVTGVFLIKDPGKWSVILLTEFILISESWM